MKNIVDKMYSPIFHRQLYGGLSFQDRHEWLPGANYGWTYGPPDVLKDISYAVACPRGCDDCRNDFFDWDCEKYLDAVEDNNSFDFFIILYNTVKTFRIAKYGK
jgi:hypothetical protein